MKHAQHQGLVSVQALPGYWARKTGGNISADVTPVWDGGAAEPEVLSGRPVADNVVTARPFDLKRDLPQLQRLRRQVAKLRTTVSVQYTDGDGYPIGRPTVYPNALLVGINEPETDAASTDASTLELTWAIGKYV